MRNLVRIAGWASAAYMAYKFYSSRQAARPAGRAVAEAPPVVELAHKLEDAWADHHTRA